MKGLNANGPVSTTSRVSRTSPGGATSFTGTSAAGAATGAAADKTHAANMGNNPLSRFMRTSIDDGRRKSRVAVAVAVVLREPDRRRQGKVVRPTPEWDSRPGFFCAASPAFD